MRVLRGTNPYSWGIFSGTVLTGICTSTPYNGGGTHWVTFRPLCCIVDVYNGWLTKFVTAWLTAHSEEGQLQRY